jgi:hypothetical protein
VRFVVEWTTDKGAVRLSTEARSVNDAVGAKSGRRFFITFGGARSMKP